MTVVTEICVVLDGCIQVGQSGASIKDFLSDDTDIIAAVLNSHLVSLDTVLNRDAFVVSVRRSDLAGGAVLRKGAQLAFQSLIRKFYPEMLVEIGQSLLGGYFYSIASVDGVEFNLVNVADHLNREMSNLISRDTPFNRELVSLEHLMEKVDDPRGSRAKLLRTWAKPRAHTVSINDCYDIQHSVMPPSSGHLKGVEVLPFPPGLVLRFGDCCDELHPGDGNLLLQCYKETRDWNETIEVGTVGELNSSILEGDFEQVVRLSEALHEKKIANIADVLCAQDSIKVVSIAGPSASGKTTFLRRLAIQLRVAGRRPLTISLDDYYRERKSHESTDLESPQALDLDLLNHHIKELLKGQCVQIPSFDFTKQKPVPEELWRPVRLEPRGILLLEGLHALNPLVLDSLPNSAVFRVFVSALTQLIIDEHNRVSTSQVRLLRRITRDRKFRGATTAQVLEQWPKVRAGERKHIFPFQDQVECLFNSSLVYEAAVLKSFAWRYLMEVPRSHPTQAEAFKLLKFLELFVPVLPDVVPDNSLLQEFVNRR